MASGQHRRPPVAVIVLVVLALAGAGYWYWSTQQAATDPDALGLPGTVESTEYQVASAIAGRITAVNVVEGDSVAAGDVIATLDDSALKLQVSQAEQGVKAAKAAVSQAKKDGTKAETDAARARQKQAEAAVEIAKIQLGYATITAPHAGTVVAVPANAGENAGPGKALATLADPADLFVRVYVPEPDLGAVTTGQAAKVTATGGSYDATVSFVAASAQFTPNTVETKEQRGNLVFEVRVRVTDPSGALKAGLPVDVEFGDGRQ